VQTNKDPSSTLGVAANDGCLSVPIFEEVFERRRRANLVALLGRDFDLRHSGSLAPREYEINRAAKASIVKGYDATVRERPLARGASRREVVTVAESHACSQLVIRASKMPTAGAASPGSSR
jgi:hypothetical protein